MLGPCSVANVIKNGSKTSCMGVDIASSVATVPHGMILVTAQEAVVADFCEATGLRFRHLALQFWNRDFKSPSLNDPARCWFAMRLRASSLPDPQCQQYSHDCAQEVERPAQEPGQ